MVHINNVMSATMEGVCNEWLSKLVAVGTDGAAVMTEIKNGVVSWLMGDIIGI